MAERKKCMDMEINVLGTYGFDQLELEERKEKHTSPCLPLLGLLIVTMSLRCFVSKRPPPLIRLPNTKIETLAY